MTPVPLGGALVLGAGIRALGIARSLGRRGVPVMLLGEPADSMARWSRHVDRYERWPASEEARVAVLCDLAARGTAGWILFPTDDEAAGLVARRRDELSTVYRVLSSSWDIVETASDKRRTYRLAADLGVPHPRTFVPADAGELRDAELEFPVILKPAMKTVANAFTDAKAWPAEDRPQLLALYEQAVRLVPPDLVMIQELVPGDGSGQLSFAALCVEGEVLASLVVRRTRQFPVDFGHSSSFVESVVDDEVEALGRLVLGRMGFTGLVEAEFKRSPGDCRPRLLDINPRVWTWHSIGRRAGVDFPYLAWRTVHGDPPAGVRGRAGARWARPATDVFAARAAVGAGTLTWSRYLRQVLPPAELAPWLATDPLPALADLPLLAVRTGRRVRANHAQSREVRAARAGAAWARRPEPVGSPGRSWSAAVADRTAPTGSPTAARRLLAAYGWVVAGAVIAAVLGAVGWLATRPTTFTSEASLLVGPQVYSNGASEPADMGTERAVATSGAVTSVAAERLGLDGDVVDRAAGARVPVDTHVLILTASGPTATEAQRRATALSDAYVSYRDQPKLPSADRPGGRPFQDVHVITAASRPLAPDSRDVVLVLVVAFVLGASVGTGAALLLDASSDRLRGAEDVERVSGLPVLARVRAGVDATRGIATLHDPSSTEVDAYHRVRASLTVGTRGRRIVLMTSGLRYDGVTVLAANVAVTIAESGVKALLVLADPQGPRTDDLFPAMSVPGLTVKDVAGPDSVALRRGGDIARAIVGAGQETVVVVAAPALLTHAGALTVADLAHGIVLVVHDHRSRRSELVRSLDLLAPARDKVHGAVVVGARRSGLVARWRTPRSAQLPVQRADDIADAEVSTTSSA